MESNMERSEYIAGLRQLADLLENNEELIIPYHGDPSSPFWVFTYSKEDLQAWARALPGKVEKVFKDDRIELIGNVRGISMEISGQREGVCERVVLGTHKVVVPAMAAQAAVPEHIKIVEDVEWICGPLLADEVSA